VKTRKVVSIGVAVSAALLGVMLLGALSLLAATQTDIVGPAGSSQFGRRVVTLPNGNFVVTDPGYDTGSIFDVGAVYVYDGATGALISQLTGSTTADQIGTFGIITLTNGNFLVPNPYWDNGAAQDAGAVTWVNGSTGLTGVVSITNSLVGTTANTYVGGGPTFGGATVLNDGNYIVRSPFWDNGPVENAGAITWGNGLIGVTGAISAKNSLVGSAANEQAGYAYDSIVALNNGNYLVKGPRTITWINGTRGLTGTFNASNSLVADASGWTIDNVTVLSNGNYVVHSEKWSYGAITWGNGTTGTTGVITAANSLMGYLVGTRVTPLSNGNYVVSSPSWDDRFNGGTEGIGAVTWCDGTKSVTGAVDFTNSLVGRTKNDAVGEVTALSNGNYVVLSFYWDNGTIEDAGAVTWGDGTRGITGVVSVATSLIGSTAYDLSPAHATPLVNGNYVIDSPYWDNGAAVDAGAITWADGTHGITGEINIDNSLIGIKTHDVSGYVTALTNGNYVVSNPTWDNGPVPDVGALTWGDGTKRITGFVSAANSLIGTTAGDKIGNCCYGFYTIKALNNGNYVLVSLLWDNGAAVDAGAVTWGDGTKGIAGEINAANSLIGSTTDDQIGSGGVEELNNGNYVAISPLWDNGAVVGVGAVTWGNGLTGVSGEVSVTNSLVGHAAGDAVGFYPFYPPRPSLIVLNNGNYVINSPEALERRGAVTWGNGSTGITGEVSIANSLSGNVSGLPVGYSGVIPVSNGSYVIDTLYPVNELQNGEALTWGDGRAGTTGTITANNTIWSTAPLGLRMSFDYDYRDNQLVIGRPMDMRVTLFRQAWPNVFFLPFLLKQ
jgi:hypothetical protein